MIALIIYLCYILRMTYPLEFRRKVLSVRKKEKLTVAEVASRFSVGVASVTRWIKKPEPCLTRNKPATKLDRAALLEDVRKYPDAYHCERAQRLGVGKTTIFDGLKRLGISYKKKLCITQKQTQSYSGCSKSRLRCMKA